MPGTVLALVLYPRFYLCALNVGSAQQSHFLRVIAMHINQFPPPETSP